MKKLPRFLICFVMVLTVLIGGYLVVLYLLDGSTSVVLQTYQITRNKEMVRRHFLAYRGEGDGMTTKINFLQWGILHPDDFVGITEGMDVNQRDGFCKLLGFTATDSGQDHDFEIAFEKYEGNCVQIIKSEIKENRKWLERWKTTQNQ